MTDGLILGVPSKGRLQQQTADCFESSSFSMDQPGGDRNYRGVLRGVKGVEIAFLSASEIAREVAVGHIHVGVTGLDLVHECIADRETSCHIITPLGFGFADVVVAVPAAWVDVQSMEDLLDVAGSFRSQHGRPMRVATKYVNLTRTFFATHGLSDYRIVERLGATEGAPAAGTAELIVDITTTGSTLRANHLKVPGDAVLLSSQAHLVASRQIDWSEKALGAIKTILDRLQANTNAKTYVEISANFGYDPVLVQQLVEEFGVQDPFGTEARPLSLFCPREHKHAVVDALRRGGAEIVTVKRLDDLFYARNPMFTALTQALG